MGWSAVCGCGISWSYSLFESAISLMRHTKIKGDWAISFRDNDFLTLKGQILTAADDTFCNIFPTFKNKKGMIFRENRLPADDSYKI